MTKEKAIEILEQRKHCAECVADCTCDECKEVFDMAICALKNEQTDGDLISRTDLLKDIAELKKSPWFNRGKDIKDLFQHNSYVARKEAVEIIEDLCIKTINGISDMKYYADYKAELNIHKADLISRDFMKKMGATCIAKRSETGELVAISSIDNLPSAEKTQPQATDGDLISRTDLLKELEKWDWQELYLPIHFKELVDELPSAEKTAEWKPLDKEKEQYYMFGYICSKCGAPAKSPTKYCSNCGARMGVEQ